MSVGLWRLRAAGVVFAVLSCWIIAGVARQADVYPQKTRTIHTAAEFAALTQGRVRLVRGANLQKLAELLRQFAPLPGRDVTVIAETPGPVVWIGFAQGLLRLDRASGSREYFGGQRWLPDDRVTGIGLDGHATWIETPSGIARIDDVPMTLEQKARTFDERVQARHNRWGLTADSRLRTPGDLSTNQMISTDNDGLWTAMYVAAECFRYAATGADDAKAHARLGMQAILRLESITGVSGFPARSFIRVGVDEQPADGEWHDTPDRLWRWKGDTSSDEIVGHFFVYPIYYDLVADAAEKPVLAAALGRMMTHIIDHDYQLVDADGRRTRWGFWGPELIWDDADETGLRALHLLAHLQVAQHLAPTQTERERYRAAYGTLITTHHYHWLTRNQKVMVPGSINHSDDELAFLSYYPLLRYETDPALLQVYRQSLERSWRIERPERNPLWNAIYGAVGGAADFDRAESLRTLREIPLDQIQWTMRNSHRLDVPVDTLRDRQGRRQALVVLPYDELPMSKWNGNPFNLDGGADGRSEDDGAYFLLPYWMGRFHGLWQ